MNRDLHRLELIASLIEMIRRRLEGKERSDLFAEDRDELDLTSFRLLHIGEATNRLSDELKARQPAIPWGGNLSAA